MRFYQEDKFSALEAKFEAQKIAFAPFVFQASKALRDLNILATIEKAGEEGIYLSDIVAQLPIGNYGVRVLVEAGLGIGLILCREEKYILTRTGYFILHDPMTRANMDFVQDVNYEGFFRLKESIENKRPEGLKVFGDWETIYPALSSLPEKAKESWFAFDHFYSDDSCNKVLPIVFKNNPKRLLDVGGNTGKWALACVKYNNEVLVTIADLPQQIALADKNIAQYAEGNRVDTYTLNILDPQSVLPKGYDAIWMSQFLDCFSEEQITGILKKAADALTDNGQLFIMETFWDRQKYEAAAFCLQQTSLYFTCMANGNSQMYRSDIFLACIAQAGLVVTEDTDHIGISHTLLTCKKK